MNDLVSLLVLFKSPQLESYISGQGEVGEEYPKESHLGGVVTNKPTHGIG